MSAINYNEDAVDTCFSGSSSGKKDAARRYMSTAFSIILALGLGLLLGLELGGAVARAL